MRPVLEKLFFFNERQSVWLEGIRSTIEEAGCPAIMEHAGRIWIGVPAGTMQCLFACGPDGIPLGVALYSRSSAATLWISHLSVDPRLSTANDEVGGGVGQQLIGKVIEIAHSIKGVSQVQLPYRTRGILRLRV